MKKIILLSALLTLISTSVFAQEQEGQSVIVQEGAGYQQTEDVVLTAIHPLQEEWARIKYQVSSKDEQLEAIHRLEEQALNVAATYPDRAEPKIWEAIILSTDAGIVKGLSALSKVEKAKDLLEESLKVDPNALQGSAYTSLGSLYYQVPGWPVSFGDNKKAEQSLKQALILNSEGIDPNFFYGDFLLQQDRFDEARGYFERALMAQDRPGRELADAGRRQEVKAALAKLDEKSKNGKVKKPSYN